MSRALSVVMVVLSCAPLAWSQVEIFADGFESGDTSAWSATFGNPGRLVVELPGGVLLALKYMPSGTFWLGSPVDERGRLDREDLHQVTLTQGYYVGQTEVTQGQWEAVTGTPMLLDCGSYGVGADYPVYCVSWNDIAGAGGFVDQLNAYLLSTGQPTGLRLPTEAEWERAARAETQTRFSHGDVLECDDYCGACTTHDQYMWWCGSQPYGASQPVGSRLANGYGLYDMHGNVYEWVQDWYTQYLGFDPVADPSGPGTGSDRVFRGGYWADGAQYGRSAGRDGSYGLDGRDYGIGFRLARTAE